MFIHTCADTLMQILISTQSHKNTCTYTHAHTHTDQQIDIHACIQTDRQTDNLWAKEFTPLAGMFSLV